MHNELCERLGIEFPIFAFTHCRDVAAAVSNAGGIGVLGAVGFSADELEVELTWLDEHVGDRPYGVDIVIPGKYEGMGELDPVKLEEELRAMIPEEHRTFAKKILADHGVPELEGGPRRELLGWTAATAAPLVEVILRHDKVKLVANALGTPPDDVIAQVHDHGMLIAALAGSVKHALNHKAAGVDIVICQGSEGGGHTGDVGSIVLWPEVIDAVAPLPVLAAGGVGSGRQMAAAMVMGAAGVWTGSLWLTVEEADVPPKQMESYLKATSRDTVRSRSFTGQALPAAQERLDRRLGGPGQPEAARDAAADDGGHRLRVPGPCLPRGGPGRELQPGRPDHRPGDVGAPDTGCRARDGRGVHRRRGEAAAGERGQHGLRTQHRRAGRVTRTSTSSRVPPVVGASVGTTSVAQLASARSYDPAVHGHSGPAGRRTRRRSKTVVLVERTREVIVGHLGCDQDRAAVRPGDEAVKLTTREALLAGLTVAVHVTMMLAPSSEYGVPGHVVAVRVAHGAHLRLRRTLRRAQGAPGILEVGDVENVVSRSHRQRADDHTNDHA